jgi:CheY-like chemotaxis protein
LGLFVCHGFVTALGGEIGVDSTLGVGTTVRVALPAASPRRSHSIAPRDGEQKRARILVIDDEPMVLEMIRSVLAETHEVTAVPGAREALERLLSGEPFDLVLCDVTMPGMSGVQFLTALEDARPDLAARLVFMTGGAVTAQTETFLENLTDGYLQKPFRARELLALVGRRLAAAT